jgi:DNA-binding NarL/FixJ family response regulator
MVRIRLLLVDDHSSAISALRGLLAGEQDFAVVAETGDWWTAVKKVNEIDMDVCIMDTSRPGLDGALATRRMKQINPAIRVIALAEDHDLHRLERLLGAGINAYIVRRNVHAELVPAIRAVMATGVYLGDSRRTPRVSSPAAPQPLDR